ncbi:hypothetical protein E2C01_023658 [Portunus trituberculatus]|uniref:Uncharacterized protein n=1 Tax=Portunus trituberculatus TaxID=210409 RepID=A0A5B7EAM3_PORTR|nr:hypothetical protein [Portunus trituberculatus]
MRGRNKAMIIQGRVISKGLREEFSFRDKVLADVPSG